MPPKKKSRGSVEKEKENEKEKKKAKKDGICLEDVSAILMNGQKSNATHKRLSGQLVRLEEKSEGKLNDLLWESLGTVLVSSNTSGVDKILRLVGMTAGKVEENTMSNYLLRKAVDVAYSEDKSARRNACELMHQCLISYNQEKADDDILDKVAVAAHDRLDDKVISVRAKAIDTAYLLQQPTLGPQCDFTQHFLQLLCTDTHLLRTAILNRLEVTKHAVPHLLRSTADVSLNVRKLAYKHLSRVPPSWLGVTQRVDLLTRGLSERNAELRKLAQGIISNWLRRENGDAAAVLAYLDIEMNEQLTGQVADVIYQVRYAEPSVPKDTTVGQWDTAQRDALCKVLTAEAVLMLRTIIKHMRDTESDRAEVYTPPIDTASDLLKACVDVIAEPDNKELTLSDMTSVQVRLLAEQVLKLCRLYEPDLHTEAQRQHVLTAVYTFANITEADHPTMFVASVIGLFKHFYMHREEELHRLITLIIDRLKRYLSTTTEEIIEEDNEDLFFDAEAQSRADQGKQDLIRHMRLAAGSLESKVEGMRKRGDSGYHAELKALEEQEVQLLNLEAEVANDTALWVRIIEIIAHVVKVERGVQIPMQYAQVILAASQSHWNPFIRSKALRVLAIYAVSQRAAAPTYTNVMVAALKKSAYPVTHERCRYAMCEAMNGIVDTFLEHGALGFYTAPCAIGGQPGLADTEVAAKEKAVAVLQHVMKLACHGDSSWEGTDERFEGELEEDKVMRVRALQGVATAGLAKLLSCNRVPEGHETGVLTQLLLFYFNPSFSSNKGVVHKQGEEDPIVHTMQMLTVFFPAYAFSSKYRQCMVVDAVLNAMRHIARDNYTVVPVEGGLGVVEKASTGMHASFMPFIANLTDASELKSVQKTQGGSKELQAATLKEASLHEKLASLCLLECCVEYEIGDKTIPKKFLKLLPHLKLCNGEKAGELKVSALAERVAASVQDKVVAQTLAKFRENVKGVVGDKGEKVTDMELDEVVAGHGEGWTAEVEKIPKRYNPLPSAKKTRKRKKESSEDLFDVKLDYSFSEDTEVEEEVKTNKKKKKKPTKAFDLSDSD